MKRCERCGAEPEGDYGLSDFCAICSADLCPKCMADGCCDHVPALSGEAADSEDPHDEIGGVSDAG